MTENMIEFRTLNSFFRVILVTAKIFFIAMTIVNSFIKA
ncbi:hypothetical protein CUZ15_02655 [Streptococcus agalactiae]|nr:hypothetical protein CUZ18_02570 [Streptococcus agalactiae]PWS58055.1 hypothetical protein CUZ51_02650 [Streptococcus agalactiae]PWS60167.1 hypothetical protein CUZ50_02650 [Streptococcus agalactiae]PWS61378.1 hypothetical protein CUZ52_02650 [Streptococcus agalactiae]PWS65044.1 hypothetical protein CUZ44_02620 [Streptococcus agalactiae]